MGNSAMIYSKLGRTNLPGLERDISGILKMLEHEGMISNVAYPKREREHVSWLSFRYADPGQILYDEYEGDSCIEMYLSDGGDDIPGHGYDWIEEGLEEVAYLDPVDDGDILMRFLVEYFKSHPKDYFYTGDDWYYNKDDVMRIYEQGNWNRYWYHIIKTGHTVPYGSYDCNEYIHGGILRKKERMETEELYGQILRFIEGLGYNRGNREYDNGNIDIGESTGRDYRVSVYTESNGSAPKSITARDITAVWEIEDRRNYNELMNIWIFRDDPFCDEKYDWIAPGLGEQVRIKWTDACGEQVMKILYEYFTLYPEDYFCCGENWYYRGEDILRIYESGIWDKRWWWKFNPERWLGGR